MKFLQPGIKFNLPFMMGLSDRTKVNVLSTWHFIFNIPRFPLFYLRYLVFLYHYRLVLIMSCKYNYWD